VNIAIVGAGHVGLVYAAGLAELGHRVSVVDADSRRITQLRAGRAWFHEPGLPELVARGVQSGRIRPTSSHAEALKDAAFVFICVPTPAMRDGTLENGLVE
jgi:UDPglucose 6-dehydrogenase